jgi:ABC-type polysaccharide/polyol phosphate transport system ATPase subunit
MTNIMKVNSPAVVTCVGLTKIYQTGIVALNDLTLTIEPGMSFGLMGENGAGKSTLVFELPSTVLNVLGIVRIPLWPIAACYQVSVSGTIGLTGVLGMLLVAVYIICLALIAGYWLERRELLLY